MANPSLKAQIEAAKSALASGLAAPSLDASLPCQPAAGEATASMPERNIAPDSKRKAAPSADTRHGQTSTGEMQNTDQLAASTKPPPVTSAAALDQRITQLEAKLADNQRDLHILLQKIREVSRFQDSSHQAAKQHTADTAVPRRHLFTLTIVVILALLAGLMTVLAYFIATENFDISRLTLAGWFFKILQTFSG